MADTALQQITAGASAATLLNENFEALRAGFLLGRRYATTTGLIFGYYGGIYGGIAVADGTVTLTNNATNYIVVEKATGTVSASTSNTNWLSGSYDRLYQVVTASGVISSVTSYRMLTIGQTAGSGDVTGPGGATDNGLVRFDGVTGKVVQNSGGAVMDDDGAIYGHRGKTKEIATTTYTLAEADTGRILEFTNASGCTVTLPNNIAAQWEAMIVQGTGAGQVTLSPASGASLVNRVGHTKTAGAEAMAMLYVTSNAGGSSAKYRLGGDTAA
jgi:hypothetical protein